MVEEAVVALEDQAVDRDLVMEVHPMVVQQLQVKETADLALDMMDKLIQGVAVVALVEVVVVQAVAQLPLVL
jgi:hypothetical protein